MRNLGIALVFLALLASGLIGMYFSGAFDSSESMSGTSVRIGQAVPDFELQDKDGNTYKLSSLQGKVVLVNFWATWCPPCRSEMPSMEQLYLNYSKGPLELLAINVESEGPEIIEEFLKESPHTFPIIFDLDGRVQQAYGVFKYPETFIVDKKGILVEKVVGAIDWTDPGVLSFLNKLIQE